MIESGTDPAEPNQYSTEEDERGVVRLAAGLGFAGSRCTLAEDKSIG